MTATRRACPLRIAILVVVATALAAGASETGLSGADGHPRGRFPLALYAPSTGEMALDAAVDRAVGDWNAVAREALGVAVFACVARAGDAQVIVDFPVSSPGGLMGRALLSATGHVIDVPVRVEVSAPQARGRTSRETLLFQVLAHELGHALGLPHVGEPASIMCCLPGSVNFDDPAARDAYVAARRHPDVGSVRAQLIAHYARFWR